MTVHLFDVETLLKRWTLGDKLHRLAVLHPQDVVAIELLVDDALMRRWPQMPSRRKTYQGPRP